jgi:hypothetical protein
VPRRPRLPRAKAGAQGPSRDPKRRGELAELAFLHKAASLGFVVSKPYGDSSRYDFILDWNGKLSRVQVKSSTKLCKGAFHVSSNRHSSGNTYGYTASDIDFLVAYVVPEDAWYVIPVRAFSPRKSLRLYPHVQIRDNKYGAFRDAWDLLE